MAGGRRRFLWGRKRTVADTVLVLSEKGLYVVGLEFEEVIGGWRVVVVVHGQASSSSSSSSSR